MVWFVVVAPCLKDKQVKAFPMRGSYHNSLPDYSWQNKLWKLQCSKTENQHLRYIEEVRGPGYKS